METIQNISLNGGRVIKKQRKDWLIFLRKRENEKIILRKSEVDYMLDYTKITFNEIDNTGNPVQVFYNYEATQTEIEKLVEEYAEEDEVPRGVCLCRIELVLTIYSKNDYKLEAVCSNDSAEQFWFELNKQFRNANEFIQLIPDYGKLRIK